MGLHFGGPTTSNRGLAVTKRGGIALHEAPTRRRHTVREIHVVQTPHRIQPEVRGAASKTSAGSVSAIKLAQHRPSSNSSAKKLAQHSPSTGTSAKIFAQRAIKRLSWAIFRVQGELFRAHAHIRPSRANFFAHKARQRGDIETNNTTAHPQQGNAETGITSAPDNCTKNTHFSPAKAMAVSTPHRYKRAKVTTVSVTARPAPAKATTVSDNRTPGLLGQAATPRHDSHGRRRGQATVRVSAGGAWPGDRWAADVTNVVKPTRFKSRCDGFCYIRRQSKPKNHCFQPKSPRIDDVCNNEAEIHTKNTSD